LNYLLVGFGKMGNAVREAAERRGHTCRLAIDPASDENGIARALTPDALTDVEVAFEFTEPAEAERNVVALLEAGVPAVCGTTGWTPGDRVDAAARSGGVGAVIAPNFSVGMNLFYRVVELTARLLGAAGQHQPYVYEAHHRAKRDVPSGTARKLARIVVDADPRLREIGEGNPEQPMPDHVLHVASIRAGTEPGTHVVGFDGEYDRITLAHGARSRTAFALGAVLAAEWVRGKAGVHGFGEVLRDLLERESE